MKKAFIYLVIIFSFKAAVFAQSSTLKINNLFLTNTFPSNATAALDINMDVSSATEMDSVFFLFGSEKDFGDILILKGKVVQKGKERILKIVNGGEFKFKGTNVIVKQNIPFEKYNAINMLTAFVKDLKGRTSQKVYVPLNIGPPVPPEEE